ncbi:MAG: DUF5916 domain-containing protein [Saprospiraceae bacterium]
MTKSPFFLLLFCLFCTKIWSQKIYTITRLEAVPALDGLSDDSCWQQITPTDIPLTSTPVFGLPALPSLVRMFYTSDALYVAATFSGAAARRDGSQRDDMGTGDWFSIGLDTWDDDQNAFVFTVTAAGVQLESRVASNGAASNWDAVWQSAVAEQADGWSVEIRLPFTALRFPVRDIQHWGLQLSRFDRTSGVLATWSPQQPLIQDGVWQYGVLDGLQDVHQRQRLSAAVQASTTLVRARRDSLPQNFGQVAVGIDGRWGFRSNATLDVALLPGSQVVWSADRIYPSFQSLHWKWRNNAPLPEPRQLLAEERPMFDKSGIFLESPFVQRRLANLHIGDYLDHYNDSQVWSAAKFAIRLPGNIGIGVHTALFGPSSRVIIPFSDPFLPREETQPLTGVSNYTLLTVEKALANNSWVSLSNASVLGNQPFRHNLSALNFQLRESRNRYQVTGNIQASVPEVHDTIYRGAGQYQFSVGKINGAWNWRLAQASYRAVDPDIINDDPALPRTGFYSNSSAQLVYRDFTARGWRTNTTGFFRLNKRWEQQTGFFSPLTLETGLSVLDRRFQQWSLVLSSDLEKELRSYDFSQRLNLLRRLSPYARIQTRFQSDARKRFYYEIQARGGSHLQGEAADATGSLSLNWTINRRFRLSGEQYGSFSVNETGSLPQAPVPGYYLRQFDALQFRTSLQLTWFCSPNFNLYTQTFRVNTKYRQQRAVRLTEDCQLVPFDFVFDHHIDTDYFQATLGGQWIFGPISQLRFQLTHYPNAAATTFNDRIIIYQRNGPSADRVNVSFIYFLDGNKKHRD